MRFPLPPTHKHIFVNGQVHPYYGGAVDENVLYTEDHGNTWVTAEEAGLPLLPPVKLPVLTPVTEPAPESEPAPVPAPEPTLEPEPEPESEPEIDAEPKIEVAATPEPFIEEMEDSVYCEYGQTQYRWNFRHHHTHHHYQKIDSYNLYENVPVDSPDFSLKVSFDHLYKELVLSEKLEHTGWRNSGFYYRETYSLFVEYRGATYEVVLVATEA